MSDPYASLLPISKGNRPSETKGKKMMTITEYAKTLSKNPDLTFDEAFILISAAVKDGAYL